VNTLRAAAQQALEALENSSPDNARPECVFLDKHQEAITALRTALAQQEQEQEPVAWSTREHFYEALDRAVGNVRQEMRIKTVTMRRKDHDIALPIIDAYSGHVFVGDLPRREWQSLPACEDKPHAVLVNGYGYVDVRAVRAIEAALKERNT
jgi:hypothetical protein